MTVIYIWPQNSLSKQLYKYERIYVLMIYLPASIIKIPIDANKLVTMLRIKNQW